MQFKATFFSGKAFSIVPDRTELDPDPDPWNSGTQVPKSRRITG